MYRAIADSLPILLMVRLELKSMIACSYYLGPTFNYCIVTGVNYGICHVCTEYHIIGLRSTIANNWFGPVWNRIY